MAAWTWPSKKCSARASNGSPRTTAPGDRLHHHFANTKNHGDITTTDWSQVAPVDIITAGYPCTPFSVAGQRTGHDHDAHLWPNVRVAVATYDHSRRAGERGRPPITRYDVVAGDLPTWGMTRSRGVVRASDAGAPHQRARLFVLATADPDGRRPQEQLRDGANTRLPVTGEHRGDRTAADADSKRRSEHGGAGAVEAEQSAARRYGTCSHCNESTVVYGDGESTTAADARGTSAGESLATPSTAGSTSPADPPPLPLTLTGDTG